MRGNGFTLLEVLLAIVLFAVLVSMVSLSLSGSLKLIEATEKQGEIYHRARTAMMRISEDIAAAMLVGGYEFIGSSDEIGGQKADTLQFPSTAHLIFNPEKQQPGLGIITYRVKAEEEDQRNLILQRSDVLYLPGLKQGDDDLDEEGFVLSDNLRSVEFNYIDADGEILEGWDSTVDENDTDSVRSLPVAVECTLSYWLNIEEERFVTFSTRVFLPAGVVNRKVE